MYTSQLSQDKLIDDLLKQKTNGYFLDIGACYWDYMSNTCFFDRERGWRGIGVDMMEKYAEGWKQNRPNSILQIGNAVEIDYQKLLNNNNAPMVIDYLSIDVDPPTTLSLEALYAVFKTDRKFNVITFETDYGGDVECNFTRQGTREDSRKFLLERGYKLIKEIYDIGKPWYHVDDLWVHESIYQDTL
jgi:hypothetical protein